MQTHKARLLAVLAAGVAAAAAPGVPSNKATPKLVIERVKKFFAK